MNLTSPAFEHDRPIAKTVTGEGADASPALAFGRWIDHKIPRPKAEPRHGRGLPRSIPSGREAVPA